MALPRDYETQTCSIARSLEIVGERWSLLVLRDVKLGRHRFDDILRSLGVTRTVLSRRLDHLVAEGVLERRPYSARPPRHEYHLTPKGEELLPVLLALLDWGDRHYPDDAGVPLYTEHAGCGGALHVEITCDRCGAHPETLDEMTHRAGPGLLAALAEGRLEGVSPPSRLTF